MSRKEDWEKERGRGRKRDKGHSAPARIASASHTDESALVTHSVGVVTAAFAGGMLCGSQSESAMQLLKMTRRAGRTSCCRPSGWAVRFACRRKRSWEIQPESRAKGKKRESIFLASNGEDVIPSLVRDLHWRCQS